MVLRERFWTDKRTSYPLLEKTKFIEVEEVETVDLYEKIPERTNPGLMSFSGLISDINIDVLEKWKYPPWTRSFTCRMTLLRDSLPRPVPREGRVNTGLAVSSPHRGGSTRYCPGGDSRRPTTFSTQTVTGGSRGSCTT